MSQAGPISTTNSPSPPNVPTSFTTDSAGSAVPASNILIVKGKSTVENNDNGIETKGGTVQTGASNEVDVLLTNRMTGALTTINSTVTTIITLPMGVTAGTFYISGNVCSFNSSTPAGAAFSFTGGYRTDGATATELGTEYHDTFQDPSLASSDIFLTTSANNILVQVQGIVALTINWNALLEYRKVN